MATSLHMATFLKFHVLKTSFQRGEIVVLLILQMIIRF